MAIGVCEMKILSFIIPSYNSAEFLDKCICSMLAQEVIPKIEIVVVNDGSTDNTAAIAEKYCADFPDAVRLISQENKGHGGALNTGCAAATGKYLKVIDADDWILTENLAEFVRVLEQCESDVVLTHHRTINISTGEIGNRKVAPEKFGENYTFDRVVANWRSFEWGLTFHGITYRRDFYQKHHHVLSEHVFYEDHEYATFPCCHAESILPLDLSVYEYRIGDVNQSVSEENQLKRLGHFETVLCRMAQEYKALPDGPGKHYAAMKVQDLLIIYLTTSLLVHPDKKTGRQLAGRQMAQQRENIPEVYGMVKWKYQVFCLLNRLHISKATWDRIMNSSMYNQLRNWIRFR